MHSCMPLLSTMEANRTDSLYHVRCFFCMVEVSSSSKSCGIPVPSSVELLSRFHYPRGNR
jgi:hypothetical protein